MDAESTTERVVCVHARLEGVACAAICLEGMGIELLLDGVWCAFELKSKTTWL